MPQTGLGTAGENEVVDKTIRWGSMRGKKVAFVNVGANSSHGTLRSPIFENGTFEFVPIPDPILTIMVPNRDLRYEDLKPWNGIPFTEFVPRSRLKQFAHVDPEFHGFTYGDYPTRYPRASNLKQLFPGDHLIFFSALTPWTDGHFHGRPGFYLIGFFEIRQIFKDMVGRPGKDILKQIEGNVHMIRAECDPVLFDGFWILKGSTRSRRFKRAVPLDRRTVQRLGLADTDGHNWNWSRFKSDMAAIGSHLRSAKIVTNTDRVDKILKIISRT